MCLTDSLIQRGFRHLSRNIYRRLIKAAPLARDIPAMKTKPRRIAAILQRQPQLATLIARNSQHQNLLTQAREALPPDLATHCTNATLNSSILYLQVDSPVWGARLRYHTPGLLSRLRAQYPGLASIRIRPRVTTPARASCTNRHRFQPHPSPHAAKHLEQVAGTISDEKLCHALRRLARTLSEKA